jgi:hypothetical protein
LGRTELLAIRIDQIRRASGVRTPVGPQGKQEEFAREVVGKSVSVQMPSAWFPIEAHSGVPSVRVGDLD